MAQYTGFVKSYNEAKGWGFIECPQTQAVYGKDIFVLRSALSGGGQGDQVMFNVVDHGRGPQASDVVVLGSARPATPLGAVNGPMNGHGYTQQMQPMPTARSAPMTLYSQPVNQHAGSSMVGTVKSYNAEKGWGFVTSPEVVEMYGKDVFFMKSSVVGGVIERNQQVSFTVVSGTKGMQAEKVCPLSPAAMPAMPRDSAFPATRAPPPLMIPVVPQMPRMLAPPAAARPAPDQLFFGAVKGYNEEKGWGHISCEAAKAVYGKEVFLHRGALGGAVVEPGTLLAFQVMMAPKGPQACEVSVLPAETFQFEGQPGRQFLGTVKKASEYGVLLATWTYQELSVTTIGVQYPASVLFAGVKLPPPLPPAPPPPPSRDSLQSSLPEEMRHTEAWQGEPEVQKHIGEPPCARPRDLSHAGMNLEPVDWSKQASSAPTLFYKEHPAVTSQSREQVQDFLQQNGVQVEGAKDLPKPIRSFDHAGFPEAVVEYLKNEFTAPTPIQSVGWPLALSGRDMVGLAQTGSGKTLAYLLPAMLHVKAQPAELGEGPVVLVLAPTRELAMQIQMEAFRVGEILGVRDAVVYGGVSRRGQEQGLRKGVDVLIATPGRLLDFLEARVTNLARVSYLVVDEADRMLDMGFEPQLRRVVSQVRPERQTVMWSATWPASIQDLAKDFCENMLKVTVGISAAKANPNIRQDIRVVTELDKKQRFFEWLQEVSPAQGAQPRVLVFTDTKRAADALCRELKYEQYAASAIHGDKDQRERDSTLYQFRKGRCQILVATDVAQRGLDIKDVAFVVNYNMPKTIEDYVHRIGRTGRAGAQGTAVSFFTCDFGASDQARMARGRPSTPRMFNAEKRWGFVTSDEITALFSGKDIFLHQNALQDASLPQVGQEVRFSIEVGESGKLQAKEVILEGVGLSATEDAGFSPVRPGALETSWALGSQDLLRPHSKLSTAACNLGSRLKVAPLCSQGIGCCGGQDVHFGSACRLLRWAGDAHNAASNAGLTLLGTRNLHGGTNAHEHLSWIWPVFKQIHLVGKKLSDVMDDRPMKYPGLQGRPNECDELDSEEDLNYRDALLYAINRGEMLTPGLHLLALRRGTKCPAGNAVALLSLALDMVRNRGTYQGSLKDTQNMVYSLIVSAQDTISAWVSSKLNWSPFFDLFTTKWPLWEVLSQLACVDTTRPCVTRSALQCYDFIHRRDVPCPHRHPVLRSIFVGCGEHDICTWPDFSSMERETWCVPHGQRPPDPLRPWMAELNHDMEERVCSQCGQDGVLRALFAHVGFREGTGSAEEGGAPPFYVEFGARKPGMLNSAALREFCAWDGILLDSQPGETPHGGCRDCPGVADIVRTEFVTAENVVALFLKHGVPRDFDLLTVDTDYNDYWIWRAILEDGTFRPRVVAVDFNPDLPLNEAKVVKYSAMAEWDGSIYTVGSLLAYALMAHSFGYSFAYALEGLLLGRADDEHDVGAHDDDDEDDDADDGDGDDGYDAVSAAAGADDDYDGDDGDGDGGDDDDDDSDAAVAHAIVVVGDTFELMGSHAFFVRSDLLHEEDHSLPLRNVKKNSHPPDTENRQFVDVLYDFVPGVPLTGAPLDLGLSQPTQEDFYWHDVAFAAATLKQIQHPPSGPIPTMAHYSMPAAVVTAPGESWGDLPTAAPPHIFLTSSSTPPALLPAQEPGLRASCHLRAWKFQKRPCPKHKTYASAPAVSGIPTCAADPACTSPRLTAISRTVRFPSQTGSYGRVFLPQATRRFS
eukprot:s1480_g5.t1